MAKMKDKIQAGESIIDVCPHQHFKYETIDRDFLSRKQHLNLLCTPKGYRWVIKKIKTSKRPPTCNPCRLVKKKPGKTYVHNILAELWELLTPEMTIRVKEILMAEFGLSEDEAIEFMCESRFESFLTCNRMKKENMKEGDFEGENDRPPEGSTIPNFLSGNKSCKSDFNIDINPSHIRNFSKVLSKKFALYVRSMMCVKRDSKYRTIAEVILRGLCDLTGEETSLDSPKNRLQKILTLTSDRIALWLAQNMDNDDQKRANQRKVRDRISKRNNMIKRQKENQKKEERQKRAEIERNNMIKAKKEQEKADREKGSHDQKSGIKKSKETGQSKGDKNLSSSNPPKPSQNKKPAIDKSRKDGKPGQPVNDRAQKDGKSGQSNKPVNDRAQKNGKFDQSNKPVNDRAQKDGKSGQSNKPVNDRVQKGGKPGQRPPNERSQGGKTNIQGGPSADQVGQKEASTTESSAKDTPQGDSTGETETADSKAQDKSSTSLMSDRAKRDASAFSAADKLSNISQASSLNKLVEILSQQGLDKTSLHDKASEPLIAAASLHDMYSRDGNPEDIIFKALSSKGLHSEIVRSQGKLAAEQSTHSTHGVAFAVDGKPLATESQLKRANLLTVKKTANSRFDVRKISYSEAKQKVRSVKKSFSSFTPPNRDPDPKSLAQRVDYTTQLAEKWGQWIDKTIQDTLDKAILYQSKAKDGKADPGDEEDWNRFVEKTNEDALKWRKIRKSIMRGAK